MTRLDELRRGPDEYCQIPKVAINFMPGSMVDGEEPDPRPPYRRQNQ